MFISPENVRSIHVFATWETGKGKVGYRPPLPRPPWLRNGWCAYNLHLKSRCSLDMQWVDRWMDQVSSPFHPHFFYTLNVCFPLPYISLPVTARAYIITIWVNMIYSVYTYECQLHWIPKLSQTGSIPIHTYPIIAFCCPLYSLELHQTWPLVPSVSPRGWRGLGPGQHIAGPRL